MLDLKDTVITGGAMGVDIAAEKHAKRRGLKLIVHHPDFEHGYDVRQFHARNEKIANEADVVYAFSSPCIACSGTGKVDEDECKMCEGTKVGSRGTKSTLKFCKLNNTPVEVIF